MADNSILPATGDVIRDLDRTGVKTQIIALDLNPAGSETLMAGSLPVTQSGTWNITNVSGTLSLPTGAATGAKQDTGNTSLGSIDTKTPALGQALAASAVPVVLTAIQAASLAAPVVSGTVAATQSGTWNINNVSGTLSLPTGAATGAKQDTGNTSLASLDTKAPALGQALAASSVPVVLTAIQAASLAAPVLGAGTAVVGKVSIDQTTPGTTNLVEARTNARRNGGTLHRNAVTAADKLLAGGTVTLSAITEAGSNLTNAAKFATICPGNRWGPGTPSAIPGSITPTANQAVRLAFAQVTGADYYDIFLSGASPPAWVGRITEAQRATGDQIISAVGVVSARGSTTAGTIDVGIVGTGLVSNVAPFASNNAYTPASIGSPISCIGYSRARLLVKLVVTDLRSLPSLTIVPFFNNQTSNTDWHQGQPISLPMLNAVGQSLEWDVTIDVDGSTSFAVAIDAIAGQGAAASIWVELS